MSEMEESKQKKKSANHWIHIPTLLAVGSFCVYWWYWHKPVPGQAVLWLAGVAVIMTLWEMRPIHKTGYLLLVICLMFLENRAIHKDRADFAGDEASRRKDEREQFSKIGTSLEDDVKKLIEDSDIKFNKTLQQQSKHFSATIGRLVAVNQEQIALARRQQEMIDSANGHLLPREEGPSPPLQSLGCSFDISPKVPIGADYYVLEVNNISFVVWKFPFSPVIVELWPDKPTSPIQWAPMHSLIDLSKDQNGDVVFAMDIRDKDGVVLIKFDENGFEVGPQLYKRHPDKSTLIVTNLRGEEVLKLTYLNKHYVRMHAHLVVDGQMLFDPGKEFVSHMCFPNTSLLVARQHNY
jgi:hypothetical protein